MRLLVVDDDPGVSALLHTVFGRLGYEVDCVFDGEAALQRIRCMSYSAVLLDLMLPRRNGFEVLREVKCFAPALLQRIVVMTAASNVTLRDFDGRQVYSVIRKPFDLDELVDTVQACSAAGEPGWVTASPARADRPIARAK